jgi:prevent-host-death family protein
MLTVKEDTTFVGVSELRTRIDYVLKKAKEHKVVIEKRHKPVAALVGIKKYEELESLLDAFEDIALGYLAKEREESSASSDYISIEEAESRLKK